MVYLKDKGFVIRRVNLGEADKFVTIFTKEHGKTDLLARGVRKITSRRSSHIELLNLIEFSSVKTRKNLILTEIQVIETYSSLKEKYANIGAMFLICELIDRLCPLNVGHEDIFILIKETLKKIEKEELEKTMSEFKINLLTLLGFWSRNRKFYNEEDLDNFIESILEGKIKTKSYYKIKK